MTDADWREILATTVRHATEFLDDCKSDHPTVMLDELEEHSEVGYFDLRRLCLERPDEFTKAGLAYDDEHRLLHRIGDPPPRCTRPRDLA
jgi:hypothetical protein